MRVKSRLFCAETRTQPHSPVPGNLGRMPARICRNAGDFKTVQSQYQSILCPTALVLCQSQKLRVAVVELARISRILSAERNSGEFHYPKIKV